MEIAVRSIITAIVYILQDVPIGTNLGIARLMWSMVNGSFLRSRGAVHSGLSENGLERQAIQESWAALRYGRWQINELLSNWQNYVTGQQNWQAQRYERYRVKSVDITAFWRPHLSGQVSEHYHALAQRTLPAVVVGVMISSGNIGNRRVPLLQRIERCAAERSACEFRQELLRATHKAQAGDEVVVLDAEFEVSAIQQAKLRRYVVRLASNCTARRNQLPPPKPRGRPCEYGDQVRPLPRKYRGKTIPASPADEQGCFEVDGRTIRYALWRGLVTAQSKVAQDNPIFAIFAFCDPLYKTPLVVATDLNLLPASIFHIYRNRWPVEHPPLAAKQMIGLHRQFVSAPSSCFRLPELALLAGNLLTHSAASLPPVPTGFWDRLPKATPGRLRRLLAKAIFPDFTAFAPEFRKKNSVFHHLPMGSLAHRRRKRVA
jgi:hypothetical protein